MKRIAVMQPYFVPYAGYFRLFAAADVMVMFDCVQFPRRGWVHRNRFTAATGDQDWLTLPFEKAARDEPISELRFAHDARGRFAASVERFPLLRQAQRSGDEFFSRVAALPDGGDAAAYLCDLVADSADRLGMLKPMVRSSTLPIAADLRGQDRVLEICRQLGATHYVNPPGGRSLYDHDAFGQAGIELGFLPPYGGSNESLLTRLLQEPASSVAVEIRRDLSVIP